MKQTAPETGHSTHVDFLLFCQRNTHIWKEYSECTKQQVTGICFAAPAKQKFTAKIEIMKICAHNLLTFTTFSSLVPMIMLEHNKRRNVGRSRRKADHLKLFDIILISGGYIMKIRFGMFVTSVLCMLLSCPGNICAQGLSIVFIRCIRAWFYKTWLLNSQTKAMWFLYKLKFYYHKKSKVCFQTAPN